MASDFSHVYPYSRRDSRSRDEEYQWTVSRGANIACKEAIGIAIREDFLDPVITLFGHKRTQWVLANSLREQKLMEDAPDWAKQLYIPAEISNGEFAVDAEPEALRSFVSKYQEMYQALELFGPEHCRPESRTGEDFKGKVLVLSRNALKESYWAPQNQLWVASGGFGCSPTASGRAVYATCLGDGEPNVRWDRSDFLGVLEEAYLPDWAAEKLAELQAPQQEQDTGPAMGGMSMG